MIEIGPNMYTTVNVLMLEFQNSTHISYADFSSFEAEELAIVIRSRDALSALPRNPSDARHIN